MPRLTSADARSILRDDIGIHEPRDFHALDSDTVDRIVIAADKYGYRAPKDANGSRARYFHAYLIRAARR